MDYIFELLYMGWIRGGLHFWILVNGVDLVWITHNESRLMEFIFYIL